MTLDEIKYALLASYEREGGINHLDGSNLPSDESIDRLSSDFMHLLFPGFFELSPLTKKDVPALTAKRLESIYARLTADIEKALSFARDPAPAANADNR